MNIKKATIDYPEDILLILNEEYENFNNKIKLLAAIKLYELGKLSLGIASKFAGLDKIDFIFKLSEYNVPVIKYSLESFQDDLKVVNELTYEK
ncbi:MAG: UPF0175 family protein [Desulfamplus sp.]|nr:UPF0175 family protein [Desulfamplus sp.]